jgi:hypothetical protein
MSQTRGALHAAGAIAAARNRTVFFMVRLLPAPPDYALRSAGKPTVRRVYVVLEKPLVQFARQSSTGLNSTEIMAWAAALECVVQGLDELMAGQSHGEGDERLDAGHDAGG